MPTAPCGVGCLSGAEPSVGWFRRVVRLTAVVGVLLAALLTAPLLPIIGRTGRTWLTRAVFRSVLLAMGVRLAVTGAAGLAGPQGRGALVVNNHTSWLDVVAVNAVRPMRAVAKRDIAGWPVLGWLVSAAGTVYVDRERLRSLPDTVAALAAALRAGATVNVTPEGTTWCGLTRGRFRPALFQAAIDGGVPVVPVALRYRIGGGEPTTAASFIGDETIVDSVRRVARLRGLVLEMHVLAELAPGDMSRRALAARADRAVDTALEIGAGPRSRAERWTSIAVEVAP